MWVFLMTGALAVCEVSTRSDYVGTIQPPTKTSYGEWGNADYCPEGHFAYGFRLKVEPTQGGGDDTAVNAIRLHCKSGDGSVFSAGIASKQGEYGDWGYSRNCNGNRFLIGAVIRSEGPQGGGDDTAVNNIDFLCEVSEGTHKLQGSGTHYGSWEAERRCPGSSLICGLQTKVEDDQGGGDDTALNEVKFFCCQTPGPHGDSSQNIFYPNALDWVPVFRFDSASECFPRSASNNENGQCRDTLDTNAEIYYEAHLCGYANIYKIVYWIFYGYQNGCFLGFGAHDNDWEHVTLNFKECDTTFCIDSIHYSQHGGWYTRQYNYYDERKNVDVYPGKIGHGNYHNTCCGGGCNEYCHGGCEYWHDFRNPGPSWQPGNVKPVQVAINQGGAVGDKIRDHWMRNQCDFPHCDVNDNEGCSRNNWRIYP